MQEQVWARMKNWILLDAIFRISEKGRNMEMNERIVLLATIQ